MRNSTINSQFQHCSLLAPRHSCGVSSANWDCLELRHQQILFDVHYKKLIFAPPVVFTLFTHVICSISYFAGEYGCSPRARVSADGEKRSFPTGIAILLSGSSLISCSSRGHKQFLQIFLSNIIILLLLVCHDACIILNLVFLMLTSRSAVRILDSWDHIFYMGFLRPLHELTYPIQTI